VNPEYFNEKDLEHLPGLLDVKVTEVDKGVLKSKLEVSKKHLAINGYLHAGTVITLADTSAGYGCMANLPDGAAGFTTIELKSNLMSTATEGAIYCSAECVHSGRTTQVWESIVTSELSGKTIAKFTCTQLILYKK
jgi:uncharacterized protein (TIGR00369 family)